MAYVNTVQPFLMPALVGFEGATKHFVPCSNLNIPTEFLESSCHKRFVHCQRWLEEMYVRKWQKIQLGMQKTSSIT